MKYNNYINVLNDGKLQSNASPVLGCRYSGIIESIVQDIKIICGNNLRSVIIRGSVARDKAIIGVSDLDMVLILYEYDSETIKKIEQVAIKSSEIAKRLFSLVDISCYTLEECLQPSNNRLLMNIKLSGITIWGEDIISILPELYCNMKLAKKIACQTIDDLEHTLAIIKSKDSVNYMGIKRGCEFVCVWYMRDFCRGLIAFTMCDNKKFTFNVRECCEEFINKYPEEYNLIEKCEALECNPISDWDKLYTVAKEARDIYYKYVRAFEDYFNS